MINDDWHGKVFENIEFSRETRAENSGSLRWKNAPFTITCNSRNIARNTI